MNAYRQDFDAMAAVVVGDGQPVAQMPLGDITTESMRTAFARSAGPVASSSAQTPASVDTLRARISSSLVEIAQST
jgi:hypothetical protein